MEGHLLCNGVFRHSLSLSHSLMQAHKHKHTQLLQTGKPGHNMKGQPLPPRVQCRPSDGCDGEKRARDKTTLWSREDGSKGGREEHPRQWWRTDREQFAHLARGTGCDKSSRVVLSVFGCVIACSEFGPLRGSGSVLGQAGRNRGPKGQLS